MFANSDDHLKNHSFIYDKENNSWELAPAYDLTYPFSIGLNFTQVSRALSINGKRSRITLDDFLVWADTFSVKNPKDVIKEVSEVTADWESTAGELDLPKEVISSIQNMFVSI